MIKFDLRYFKLIIIYKKIIFSLTVIPFEQARHNMFIERIDKC